MAQAPKQGIPPAPPVDPNAGKNIHGQPNYPTPGQPPQSNMAPPTEGLSGLAARTKEEMEAGKKNLQQYFQRDDAEHEAGRKLLQQHAGKN